jgi:phenylacetate-CoA ligase
MNPTAVTDSRRARRHAAIRAALPAHLERLSWDRRRIAEHQRDALRALLRHAMAWSPFHRARLTGIAPDRFELEDLARLPTMTNREMMASLDDVFTDPRLTRDAVEKHLTRTGRDPSELFGEYLVLASGGSSGERGVFTHATRPRTTCWA